MSGPKLDRRQLAEALGISPRSLEPWLKRGCPHLKDGGRVLFDEAVVREWLRAQGLTGRPGRPSQEGLLDGAASESEPSLGPPPAPLREGPVALPQSLAKAELARKISIARKNELTVQAERGLKELGLDLKIREATSREALAALSREIAALVASGALLPGRGMVLHKLLVEQRRNLKDPSQDPEELLKGRVILATAEGATVLRLFEALVSDERRRRLQTLLEDELEADLKESPPCDAHELRAEPAPPAEPGAAQSATEPVAGAAAGEGRR